MTLWSGFGIPRKIWPAWILPSLPEMNRVWKKRREKSGGGGGVGGDGGGGNGDERKNVLSVKMSAP